MKFKDCLVESAGEGFTDDDAKDFAGNIKMHNQHHMVDNIKAKGGKIHYHLDGMSGSHLKKVGDAVHNVFNGKVIHKYKSPAEAGKGIALSLAEPEDSYRTGEVFATDPGHSKHKAWCSTLHHSEKKSV